MLIWLCPKGLHHNAGVSPLGNEQGRAGVPEIVKRRRRREPPSPHREEFLPHLAVIEGTAQSAWEHQAGVQPVAARRHVLDLLFGPMLLGVLTANAGR